MSTTDKNQTTGETKAKSGTAEPSADVREWQDKKVRAGIKAANEGRFASASDVRRVIRKYVPDE